MLTAKENMRRAILNEGPDRYVNQYEAMKLLFHPFMFHNPMAQKGEAGRALSVAMFSSFCGGVIGALIMTFLSPLVAKVAMKFTSAEMLMLAVFGLSVIISISGKSIAKGLISAFFGMLLCTIGLDPTYSKQRFTFGITSLKGGLSFIPVLIGLFAVAEVIAGVERIIAGKESAIIM